MIAEAITDPVPTEDASAGLKAVIEAAIYITDEPLTAAADGLRSRSTARSREGNSGAELVQEYVVRPTVAYRFANLPAATKWPPSPSITNPSASSSKSYKRP